MHLKFDSGILLRITPTQDQETVTLTRGHGAHRFRVAVTVKPETLTGGVTVVQLSGELYAGDAAPLWIGDFVPVSVPLLSGKERTTELVCAVTDPQVLALEQDRRGQDLTVEIRLHATLPQGPGEYPFAHDQDRVRVPASKWGAQLEGLGRALAVTVAVPLPHDEGPHAEAGAYLREAKRLIIKGEYESAVAQVRNALEQMRLLKHWPLKPPKGQTDPAQWGQDVRWGVILQSLYAQACGAVHADDVTKHFTYSREDAMSLLSGAAGILHQLSMVPSP